MARLAAPPVQLTDLEQSELEHLVRCPSMAQQIVLRAKIILRAGQGDGHGEISRGLGVSKEMSRTWRRRWLALRAQEVPVIDRLKDAPRPGAPATFSVEQITQLYAIACAPPEQYGRPISHWSPQELADELINQGIVETISPRHVGRLLAEADLKPHQTRYWLHPPRTSNSSLKSRPSVRSTSRR